MHLPNFVSEFGPLGVFIPLLGLILSLLFNKRSFAPLFWWPTVFVISLQALWVFWLAFRCVMVRSASGSGYEVLSQIFGIVVGLVAIAGFGALAYLLRKYRPSAGPSSPRVYVGAGLVCVLVSLASVDELVLPGAPVFVEFRDEADRALPQCEITGFKRGRYESFRRKAMKTDEQGRLRIYVGEGDDISLDLRDRWPKPETSVLLHYLPGGRGEQAKLKVTTLWNPYIGPKMLDNTLIDLLPAKGTPIIVVRRASNFGCCSEVLLKDIARRIALLSRQPDDDSLRKLCASPEALDSLDALLLRYENEPAVRPALSIALSGTAEGLEQMYYALNSAAENTRLKAAGKLAWDDGDFQRIEESAPGLGAWCKTAELSTPKRIEAAQAKVAALTGRLAVFCIKNIDTTPSLLLNQALVGNRFITELPSGVSEHVTELFDAMQRNPVRESSELSTLEPLMKKIAALPKGRARFDTWLESENPCLVLIAGKALEWKIQDASKREVLRKRIVSWSRDGTYSSMISKLHEAANALGKP